MRMDTAKVDRRIATVRAVAALALVLTAVPAFVSAASAQVCDPVYGCPPVTEPGTTPPTCSINASTVSGGETVTASVRDLDPGAAFQVTVDGTAVANGVGDASGNANVSFVVSQGIGEGSHPVFVVGAGFSASCGELTGADVEAGVIDNGSTTTTLAGGVGAGNQGQGQGQDQGQGQGQDQGQDQGRVGAGSLARTGLEIAFLLVLAICLLLVGQRLLVARRRRLRRRNAVAPLAAPTTTSR
jgi:hypothetical protein